MFFMEIQKDKIIMYICIKFKIYIVMFSYYIEKLVSAYFDAFSAALQEIHKKQMEECEQGMKELKRLILEEAANEQK